VVNEKVNIPDKILAGARQLVERALTQVLYLNPAVLAVVHSAEHQERVLCETAGALAWDGSPILVGPKPKDKVTHVLYDRQELARQLRDEGEEQMATLISCPLPYGFYWLAVIFEQNSIRRVVPICLASDR